MTIEFRTITDGEWPDVVRTIQTAFGRVAPEDLKDPARRPWPLDRSVAAIEDGRVVGTGASYPMELTLPGGATEPCAGVTWVSVLPTHRRRGVLTGMMAHQVADLRARGEAIAALLASESIIYGQFGYGLATRTTDRRIDRRHTALRNAPEPVGRVVLLDADDARKVLPGIHDRSRLAQPGDLSRTELWWEAWFHRPKENRFFAVHEGADGAADGYAVYLVKPGDDWLSSGTVEVDALVSSDANGYVDLFRFVTDIDLTQTIKLANRPVSEPIDWMLVDARRLETTRLADFLWVRLIDVAAALARRTYATAERFVIEVTTDDLCPWNVGRWALETGTDGATCVATTDDADLVLPVAALGAAFLGGSSLAEMVRAGHVAERRPGIARRADSAFAADPVPWCQTFF